MSHPITEKFDDPHGLSWKQWLLLLLALVLGVFSLYVVKQVPFSLDHHASTAIESQSRDGSQ
jgi:hypothetical protein